MTQIQLLGLKRMIVEGKIQTITALFNNIPVVETIKKMGRLGDRVQLCRRYPGKWQVREIHKLAEVLEMDPDIIFVMMANELMAWNKKPG